MSGSASLAFAKALVEAGKLSIDELQKLYFEIGVMLADKKSKDKKTDTIQA